MLPMSTLLPQAGGQPELSRRDGWKHGRGLFLGRFLTAKAPAFDFLKGARCRIVERGHNRRQVFLEDMPVNGQHYHCNVPPGEVLLVRKRLVAGNEHLEAVIVRCSQTFAVLQPRPAFLPDRENVMIAEVVPQQMREILIEQHFHGTGCPRRE